MFESIAAAGVSLRAPRIKLGRLMPAGTRAWHAMFFAILLSLAAYFSVVSCKIEEPTKVIQMERMQIDANHGKERSDGSVGMVSRSLRSTMETTMSQKIKTTGEEEKAIERDVQQPEGADHHRGEFLDKENIRRSDQAEPQDMQARPTWKTLEFPSDTVLLLQCSGDELTVRIRPRLDGFEEYYVRIASGDLSDVCARRLERPSMYDAGPHYHALFWSLPEEEGLVPVPPPEVAQTTLIEEETPERFTFSTDIVVVYRPTTEQKRKIHILAREAVEFRPAVGEELEAVRALGPDSIIFWTKTPYTTYRTFVASQ
ncbi:uncharacterized protein [Triticum aestivum]|uniref:uncharacterized protein n=1 Tax=Triticum aestivum TaxID=4565 RepID=UPI001D01F136|nr:uncharacterized protein LOC123065321 [Triticum aestivum]